MKEKEEQKQWQIKWERVETDQEAGGSKRRIEENGGSEEWYDHQQSLFRNSFYIAFSMFIYFWLMCVYLLFL